MDFTVISDIGRKRSVNEDRANVFVRSDFVHMAIVADGMGGHKAGDVASQMVLDYLYQVFLQAESSIFKNEKQASQWLSEEVKKLNHLVYDHSLTHEECNGMGTTLLAFVFTKEWQLLCHLGDSRVYILASNDFLQVTKDHTYVNMLLEHGEITEEEAENHPKKHFIVNALGTERTIRFDIISLTNYPLDRILLCSDGLSNKVPYSQLQQMMLSEASVKKLASSLVEKANENGGEDNITLIVIDFTSEVTELC